MATEVDFETASSKLSKTFRAKNELEDLGTKLKQNVGAALMNNPGDFYSAASTVMRGWRTGRGISDEAAIKELGQAFYAIGKVADFNKTMTELGYVHLVREETPKTPAGPSAAQYGVPPTQYAGPPAAQYGIQPAAHYTGPPAPQYGIQPATTPGTSTDSTAPSGQDDTDGPSSWKVPSVPDPNDKESSWYKMGPKVGRGLIINHTDFTGRPDKKRKGADEDEREIKKVFGEIGIEFTNGNTNYALVYETKKELEEALEKVASAPDLSAYSSFCCFLGSHGKANSFRTTNWEKMKIEDLIKPFKGKLPGKPKLFFIQTCRGSSWDEGVDDDDDDDDMGKIPIEADIFIFYSTSLGYKARRTAGQGTPFFQCLCAALDKLHMGHDMMEIATVVSKMVSGLDLRSEGRTVKQMPAVASTFTKKLVFRH